MRPSHLMVVFYYDVEEYQRSKGKSKVQTVHSGWRALHG